VRPAGEKPQCYTDSVSMVAGSQDSRAWNSG
jgi:hypothetical protein